MGFWDTNRLPYIGQTTKPSDSQQKKKERERKNFAVPADRRVKLKENEKKYKNLDLASELNKL